VGSCPSASEVDAGFDGVVVGADAFCAGLKQAGAGEGLYIGMDIAVIAAECFGQRPHTGDMVVAHVAQQFHTLAGDDAREGIPAFKGQMALVEGLASLARGRGLFVFEGAFPLAADIRFRAIFEAV